MLLLLVASLCGVVGAWTTATPTLVHTTATSTPTAPYMTPTASVLPTATKLPGTATVVLSATASPAVTHTAPPTPTLPDVSTPTSGYLPTPTAPDLPTHTVSRIPTATALPFPTATAQPPPTATLPRAPVTPTAAPPLPTATLPITCPYDNLVPPLGADVSGTGCSAGGEAVECSFSKVGYVCTGSSCGAGRVWNTTFPACTPQGEACDILDFSSAICNGSACVGLATDYSGQVVWTPGSFVEGLPVSDTLFDKARVGGQFGTALTGGVCRAGFRANTTVKCLMHVASAFFASQICIDSETAVPPTSSPPAATPSPTSPPGPPPPTPSAITLTTPTPAGASTATLPVPPTGTVSAASATLQPSRTLPTVSPSAVVRSTVTLPHSTATPEQGTATGLPAPATTASFSVPPIPTTTPRDIATATVLPPSANCTVGNITCCGLDRNLCSAVPSCSWSDSNVLCIAAPAVPTPTPSPPDDSDGGFELWHGLLIAGIALLLLALLFLWRRRNANAEAKPLANDDALDGDDDEELLREELQSMRKKKTWEDTVPYDPAIEESPQRDPSEGEETHRLLATPSTQATPQPRGRMEGGPILATAKESPPTLRPSGSKGSILETASGSSVPIPKPAKHTPPSAYRLKSSPPGKFNADLEEGLLQEIEMEPSGLALDLPPPPLPAPRTAPKKHLRDEDI